MRGRGGVAAVCLSGNKMGRASGLLLPTLHAVSIACRRAGGQPHLCGVRPLGEQRVPATCPPSPAALARWRRVGGATPCRPLQRRIRGCEAFCMEIEARQREGGESRGRREGSVPECAGQRHHSRGLVARGGTWAWFPLECWTRQSRPCRLPRFVGRLLPATARLAARFVTAAPPFSPTPGWAFELQSPRAESCRIERDALWRMPAQRKWKCNWSSTVGFCAVL